VCNSAMYANPIKLISVAINKFPITIFCKGCD
jgi:hypothetical protein